MHIWGAGLLTMFSKICVAVYKAAAVVEWPRPIIRIPLFEGGMWSRPRFPIFFKNNEGFKHRVVISKIF